MAAKHDERTVWIDDPNVTLCVGYNDPDSNGVTRRLTLAAMLEDEAGAWCGSAYFTVIRRCLKREARKARRLGIQTAEEYLARGSDHDRGSRGFLLD